MRKRFIATNLVLIAGCGFPKPADVASDASRDTDSSANPESILHVSLSGDDANDGITGPVKTLKHAIGLSAQNAQITGIVLATGRYSTDSGEGFPYVVTPGLTVEGPAGGGAILAGTGQEQGLLIEGGTVNGIEMENFLLAVDLRANAQLSDLHVHNSALAVRVEANVDATINGLEIVGYAGACATGAVIDTGGGSLTLDEYTTRGLGTIVDTGPLGSIVISNANVLGDGNCTQPVVSMRSSQTLSIADSVIDGGKDGIEILVTSGSPRVKISNTVVRNMRDDALGGAAGPQVALNVLMTGGRLANNARGGVEVGGGGNWTFTDVMITQNGAFGVYFQGNSPPSMDTITMRGCSVTGMLDAVYLFDGAYVDFGTISDPGNNTFRSQSGVGLNIAGGVAPRIDAVGNTWHSRVQGSDANGHYLPSSTPITGSIGIVAGDNYAIAQGYVNLYL